MDNPTLSLNETGVIGTLTLPTSNILAIHATHLVQQSSGLHAKMSIQLDGTELARTVMNIDRLEDRIKLANAAYKDFHPTIKKAYSADFLKIHLAYVCGHAWEKWVEAYMPTSQAGRPDLQIEYALDPFVIRGGGTILFGPPGAGKSYVGMAMAVSIDAGKDALWPVNHENAGWVNLERSPNSVLWRLAHINKALGLPPERPLFMLHARGKRFRDVHDLVKAATKRHSIGFWGVDSLTRMGVGSLVKDESINESIDMLNSLGCTWLTLGHNPTSTEAHVYGGNLWDAGADVTAQLTSVRKAQTTGIRIEAMKANDAPLGKPHFYALEFAPGLEGLQTLRLAFAKEFPELSGTGPLVEVVSYLKDHSSATATQMAKDLKLPRSKLSTLLNSHPDVFVHYGPKTGKGQEFTLLTSFDPSA